MKATRRANAEKVEWPRKVSGDTVDAPASLFFSGRTGDSKILAHVSSNDWDKEEELLLSLENFEP